MSNIEIRPVQLRGNSLTASPRKLPLWAPPGQEFLFDKKRMGQKKPGDGFSSEAVPKSLAFALAGAGSVLIGTKMPSPFGGLMVGAGLISIGYSVYNLFSGSEPAAAGVRPDGEAKDIPEKQDFDRLTGAFKKPRMNERVEQPWYAQWNWLDIDVVYVVTNPSSRPVSVTLRFTQKEVSNRGEKLPTSKNTATYFKTVVVPQSTSVDVELEIDTLNWSGGLSENLIVEKLWPGGQGYPEPHAVKMSEVTFFVGAD